MNRLVYFHESKRIEVPLTGAPVSFGRGEDASHRLPCKVASRLHAHVFSREGGWFVEDLGSQNGTILNGKKIEGIVALKAGDKVGIGTITLMFESDAPAPLYKEEEARIARLLYKPEGERPHDALITERITIGRAKDNVFDIDHKVVSSHHCYVEARGKQYVLVDLDSSNGTYVGEQKIKEHVLRNGDVIALGKVVKIYFIDPVAAPAGSPVPQAPAPVPPPARPASGQQPAARPVSGQQPVARPVSGQHPTLPAPKPPAEPPAPVAVGGAAALNIFIGILLLAGLGAAGWFGAEGLKPAPQTKPPAPASMAPLEDVTLSFEGEVDNQGNPAGWSMAAEAPKNATIELTSDAENPADGSRCLRIVRGGNMAEPALISLQHREPTPFPATTSWRLSVMLRGEAASAVCVTAGTQAAGIYTAAATTGVVKLGPAEWTQVRALGLMLLAPAPESRLTLQVSGQFNKLWIDRVVIEAGPVVAEKPGAVSGGEYKLELDASRPGLTRVLLGETQVLTIMPRIIATSTDRDIAEPEFWSCAAVDSRSYTFMAALPSKGVAEAVDISGETRTNSYFADAGLGLKAGMRRGAGDASLALEIVAPLAAENEILVADRAGAMLKVNLAEFHIVPYSTISEVTILPNGPCLSFPRGVVAWFDLARPGKLGVTVRASGMTRSEAALEIYPRSVAEARIFARVLQEAQEFEKLDLFSAALARYQYVADNAPAALSSPLAARARIAEIGRIRDRMRKEVDAAYDAAAAQKTPVKLEAALARAQAFIGNFSADADVKAVQQKIDQLQQWKTTAAPVRPPKELQIAIGIAKGFYEAAVEQHKTGHVLFALLLLDNVIRDYSDTPYYKDAIKLFNEINAPLNDAAKRDAAIDSELKAIDVLCDRNDWNGALERCRALFKRFPDTPRNRDIMVRMHKIEAKFKG
ncbi:MAG: FHA domain-containing protein [Planctomycetes bacterium]|nr:FHA domain-containing protein [Planctomycetota bacterium]